MLAAGESARKSADLDRTVDMGLKLCPNLNEGSEIDGPHGI